MATLPELMKSKPFVSSKTFAKPSLQEKQLTVTANIYMNDEAQPVVVNIIAEYRHLRQVLKAIAVEKKKYEQSSTDR